MLPFLYLFALLASSACRVSTALQNILVTGAAGRTGQWVVQELLDNPQFTPTAVVRNERSARSLRKRVPRLGLDQIVVWDVVDSTAAPPVLPNDGLVICTSAVPILSQRSFWAALLRAPWNRLVNGRWINFRQLSFRWKHGQTPEAVDYHGQVAQMNLALQQQQQKNSTSSYVVVLVSSMGGSKPDHFLNTVGRRPDGTGGDILLWKRQSELFLTQSGLDYIILHPGALKDNDDDYKDEDDSTVALGVNDMLDGGRISRRTVARLCVTALQQFHSGQRLALDCVSVPEQKQQDLQDTWQEFVQSGVVYNYETTSSLPESHKGSTKRTSSTPL